MREHQGLGDKDCPKCASKGTVHWLPNFVRREGERVIEFGYFRCSKCNWKSEHHKTTIVEAEKK